MKSLAGSFPNRRRAVLLGLATIWVLIFVTCKTEGYTLRVKVQPGNAAGGIPFGLQPHVEVLQEDGSNLATFLDGYVTAELQPGRPERLRVEGESSSGGDGAPAISTPIIHGTGLAQFENLFLNEAGENYVIRFVVFSSSGIGLAWIDSLPFDTLVGEANRLKVTGPIGTVFGGRMFDAPVEVAVVDAGSNIVKTFMTPGSVTCSMSSLSMGEGSLFPSAEVTAPIVEGIAIFDGLSIDVAGNGYILEFETTIMLPEDRVIRSREFTVSIGPASGMLFLENPAALGTIVKAGQPLPVQPRLVVVDAGGNHIVEDSASAVQVSISSNPTKATIEPEYLAFEVLSHGVATFSGNWSKTKVGLDTIAFDVQHGMPAGLRIDQEIDGSWSGGSGFKRQPIVSIVDGGGNIVSSDSSTMVLAHMTPSMTAGAATVIIDTSNSSTAGVEQVMAYPAGISAPGAHIYVSILFSAPVVVNATQASGPMGVELATTNTYSGSPVVATLLEKSHVNPSNTLEFEYIVKEDDVVLVVPDPGFLDANSLQDHLNGNEIQDLLGRAVNTTLIPQGSEQSIVSSASITFLDENPAPLSLAIEAKPNITTWGLDEGVIAYGPGHLFTILITFSYPVVVVGDDENGQPIIPLLIDSVVDVNATFTGVGNGTETLQFSWEIPMDVNIDGHAEIVSGSSILLPIKDWLTWTDQPQVFAASENPIWPASLNLSDVSGEFDFFSTTSLPPSVSTVTSSTLVPGRRHAPGDSLNITVTFNEPICVSGDVALLIDAQGSSSSPSYAVLDSYYHEQNCESGGGPSLTLNFRYIVEVGHYANPSLDVMGISLGDWGAVKRYASNPVLDADISLQSPIDTLLAGISIDGTIPEVVKVTLSGAWSAGGSATADDVITFDVVFNDNVLVMQHSSSHLPIIEMNPALASIPRWAVYVSGLGTSTLTFEYRVRVGDSTATLSSGLSLGAGLICLSERCGEADAAISSYIVQMRGDGMAGQNVARALLPNLLLVGSDGSSVVTVDTSGSGGTVIPMSMSTPNEAGLYGPADVIEIEVIFSDEVLLDGSSSKYPQLRLNTGNSVAAAAAFVGGLGSSSLTFSYTTILGDSIPILDVNSTVGNTAVDCESPTCTLIDRNGGTVDLTTTGFGISSAGIEVDTEWTPSVVSISFNVSDSAQDWDALAPGETVSISIEFSGPVAVEGKPLLHLTAGIAEFASVDFENSNLLWFTYTIQVGDFSSDLSWEDEEALKANDHQTNESTGIVYRAPVSEMSVPLLQTQKLLANISLPNPSASLLQVDGLSLPYVMNLASPSGNGVYAPGDTVRINATYSGDVSVVGFPWLLLNTKAADNSRNFAIYSGGTGSRTLQFHYTVIEGDYSHALDLSDNHAIRSTFRDAWKGTPYESKLRDSIFAAVSEPHDVAYANRLEADAVIPFKPGEEGSLSNTSVITILGIRPYIVSIHPVYGGDVNDTVIHSAGNTIYIEMIFSAPVIVLPAPTTGLLPTLLLETGSVDREATYVNGSETDTLWFQYVVEVGDHTQMLDYWSDQHDWRWASSSFQLNDASIKLVASTSSLDANIHLNPPHGVLLGTDCISFIKGQGHFHDLDVHHRGRGYEVHFTSVPFEDISNSIIGTSTSFNVDFRIETEIVSEDGSESALFGKSIDLGETIMAIGAPGKHKERPEIQVIRTTNGSNGSTIFEVQLIATEAHHLAEIQSFSTVGDPLSTLGGTWTLTYPAIGTTRPISYNAAAEQVVKQQLLFRISQASICCSHSIEAHIRPLVESILHQDLPETGRVDVVREENTLCSCDGAFHWTFTFTELEGNVLKVEIDDAELTGQGAAATDVTIIQESPVIGGTFQLMAELYGDEDNPVVTTRSIPHNATSSEMTTAITEDLGLDVINIAVDCCDGQGGRKWVVTFGQLSNGNYDVPSLKSISSELTGEGATVWHLTGRNGTGPLSGGFSLRFRGSSWTEAIPYDATASYVEEALLGLGTIDACNVSRSEITGDAGQKEWKVTFISTREFTSYGFVPDTMMNLPPIEVDASNLRGTKADIVISYVSGGEEDYAPWEGKQMGSYGYRTGAAYVFEKTVVGMDGSVEMHEWQQIQKLLGADTTEEDSFGEDVSVDGSLLLVGAPHTGDVGKFEQQSIACSGATGGTFQLSFRGFTTDPIPYNATLLELKEAIRGPFGTTHSLHPIPELWVSYGLEDEEESWTEGCCGNISQNTVILTLPVPEHGYYGGPADLELLEVVNPSSLEGSSALIVVSMVESGDVLPSGRSSKGLRNGAAYVFRRSLSSTPGSEWLEEKKLVLTDGRGGDRFGQTVVVAQSGSNRIGRISTDYAIVGAPGSNDEAGSISVFAFESAEQSWKLLQTLTAELWRDDINAHLGYSMSLSDGTLAVGTPGFNSSNGAVYIWKLASSGVFQAVQQILNPAEDGGSPGDSFGSTIALHNNTLVVGSPGREDLWQYTGSTLSSEAGKDTGAVYTFVRQAKEDSFAFEMQLHASNVKPFDRLGVSVGIYNSVIVVGSCEYYESSALALQKFIQVVTVQATECCIGKTYRLGWKVQCQPGHDCVRQWTRKIDSDTDAATLKSILQEDFGFGLLKNSELFVERSDVDPRIGGHQYRIIFSYTGSTINISPFIVDDSELVGKGAYVSVDVVNTMPRNIRSTVHVFQRYHPGDLFTEWVEECFLHPGIKQRQDLFGSIVSISDAGIVMGGPNRNTHVVTTEEQDATSINTGAVKLYSYQFLNYQFAQTSYEVSEGDDSLELMVLRRDDFSGYDRDAVVIFRVRSMDRNAEQEMQTYIAEIFDLYTTDVGIRETVASIIFSATATGCYENASQDCRSLWLDSIFDYHGLSDYVSVDQTVELYTENSTASVQLLINDDNIVEPEETLTIAICTPGMLPSVLGDIVTRVVIEDNGDGDGIQLEGLNLEDWGTTGSTHQYSPFRDQIMYTSRFSVPEGGGDIDSDATNGRIIVGVEWRSNRDGANVLPVQIYLQELGTWALETELWPHSSSSLKFGSSVAIHTSYGHNTLTAAVGDPGSSSISLYDYDNATETWNLTTIIEKSDSMTEDLTLDYTEHVHSFGDRKTLALADNILVVGVPGLEAILVFHRVWIVADGRFDWVKDPAIVVKSPDWDKDVVLGVSKVHHQSFGASVATDSHGHTLVVGSPFADYDKLGTDKVETYDTYPQGGRNRARGRVCAYYRPPHCQKIVFSAINTPMIGTFVLSLNHRGQNITSSQLKPQATAPEVIQALEAMDNIDRLEVSINSFGDESSTVTEWLISFLGEHENIPPPPFVAAWNGAEDVNSTWSLQTALLARTDQATGRFGAAVAVDGKSLIVGAPLSRGVAATTWDFEMGDLSGWVKTGTAFDFQPTFGDNAVHRSPNYESIVASYTNVNSKHAESPGHIGRYYIGTFESRPGSDMDYRAPSSKFPAGSIQGDEPVETLTSNIFIIGPGEISFLIGGGCDFELEYVELIVDGVPYARATGQCRGQMRRVSWDVSDLEGRAARIQIVDMGTKTWGDINVDDFRFSWTNTFGSSGLLYTEGAPQPGAAYIYVRSLLDHPDMPCPQGHNRFGCSWVEASELVPSDRRAGDRFGYSVALVDSEGIAVVGAPDAELYGLWGEQPTYYTTQDPFGSLVELNGTKGGELPLPEKTASILRLSGGYGAPSSCQAGSGGPAVWLHASSQVEIEPSVLEGGEPLASAGKRAGSLYVFTRKDHHKDPSVCQATMATTNGAWSYTERFHFQAHDLKGGERFGVDVALIKGTASLPHTQAFVRASETKQGNTNTTMSGSLYQVDLGISHVSFTESEYEVLEGKFNGLSTNPVSEDGYRIAIHLERDSVAADTQGELTVSVATSELTAQGVDSDTYAACMAMPMKYRGEHDCGDYEQTANLVTFGKGQTSAYIFVRVMDNSCREPFPKYLQLTMSIPGTNATHGEHYKAKLRIDDDDFDQPYCDVLLNS